MATVAPEVFEFLQPLIDVIQPILLKISLLIGGLFGLYLILIIARVHYERKKVHLLKDIRYNLDELNIHYNIPNSKDKKGIFRKAITKIKNKKNNTTKTDQTNHKKNNHKRK